MFNATQIFGTERATQTHANQKVLTKKTKNPPNKQNQSKAKPHQNPQSLSDQGRKSPLLKQDCQLQLEFFPPCF